MGALCCCCGPRPVWRGKVKFRLRVLDIQFCANEYFLVGSTFTIFQKRHRRNRIKSPRVCRSADDLSCIEIDETLKIKTVLKQDLSSRYLEQFLPKKKKIVLRQVTKVSESESIYKDVGFVLLNLHEIAQWESGKIYEFALQDTGGGAEATLRIEVQHQFVPNWECKFDPFARFRKPPKQLKLARWSENESFFGELLARSGSFPDDTLSEVGLNIDGFEDGEGEDGGGPERDASAEDALASAELLCDDDFHPAAAVGSANGREARAAASRAAAVSRAARPGSDELVDRVCWSKPFSASRSHFGDLGDGEANIDFVVFSSSTEAASPTEPIATRAIGSSTKTQRMGLRGKARPPAAALAEGGDEFGLSFYDIADV